MMLSEENSDLEKQMGCMAGIFQIFDRGQMFAGRRFNRQKRLTSGKASLKGRDNPVEQKKPSKQAILEKIPSKSPTENSSLSMESSRASCSSSSCSSFSSVNNDNTFYTPKETLIKPKTAPCYNEFRSIVKDSINRGEPHDGLTLKTVPKDEVLKKNMMMRNDSPRPLLISKSTDGTYVIGIDRTVNYEYELKCNSYNNNNDNDNNNDKMVRFSCDGREIPKDRTKSVTGLRDLPRLSLDSRKESMRKSNYDNSPGHRRSNSLIAKLMGLDLFPDCNEHHANVSNLEITTINPVVVEVVKSRRDNCLSNFSKSDGLNSVNSGLGVKTKNPVRIGTESAPWIIQQEKINASKKTVSEMERRLRDLELQAKERVVKAKREVNYSQRSFDDDSSPIVIMKPSKERRQLFDRGSKLQQQISKENGMNSPRTPKSTTLEKDSEFNKKSRPSSPWSPKRNSVPESNSPRSKCRPKSCPAKKSSCRKSADQVKFAAAFVPDLNKEKISDKEMTVISPISVLDASFYHDELTPVKRISDSFRDGETCTSEDSWNPTSLPATPPPSDQIKSENIETLIQKLEQLSLAKDKVSHSDQIVSRDPKTKDHEYEYIKEILIASGLLHKDLSFFALPHHAAECPINPDLFLVLEQTKSGSNERRRLTFDLVNEILGDKLERIASLSGERLVKGLCDEIDKLRTEAVKSTNLDGCEDANEEEEIGRSGEQALRQMRGWDKFETELQGMVLEIERSVFKDLVDEIVEIECSENFRQRRLRRQLF